VQFLENQFMYIGPKELYVNIAQNWCIKLAPAEGQDLPEARVRRPDGQLPRLHRQRRQDPRVDPRQRGKGDENISLISDRANFRPMGDFLLWAVLQKLQK
jgi:hypothetical protein